MDFKLELVLIPVADVDRAKQFYVDEVRASRSTSTTSRTTGFRVVQLTPPGIGLLADVRDRDHRRGAGQSYQRHPPRRHRHRGRRSAELCRSRSSRMSEIRHMRPGRLAARRRIPSTATTTRSPTSATPTATRGCCRSRTASDLSALHPVGRLDADQVERARDHGLASP